VSSGSNGNNGSNGSGGGSGDDVDISHLTSTGQRRLRTVPANLKTLTVTDEEIRCLIMGLAAVTWNPEDRAEMVLDLIRKLGTVLMRKDRPWDYRVDGQ
jgi:hypothetical protein